MKCRKNKHQTLIQDYRHLIGEQAKTIKEQMVQIEQLKTDIQALKRLSITDYQFYLKKRAAQDKVIEELDRILTKFNC
jgi:uncharacterized coiled-coil protein SlyX